MLDNLCLYITIFSISVYELSNDVKEAKSNIEDLHLSEVALRSLNKIFDTNRLCLPIVRNNSSNDKSKIYNMNNSIHLSFPKSFLLAKLTR